jgi:hypothetical protein
MLSPSETTTISTFRNSHDDLSLPQSPRKVDVIDDLYDFFSDDTTVADDDIVAFGKNRPGKRPTEYFKRRYFWLGKIVLIYFS